MSEIVLVVDLVAATGKADELVAAFEACIGETHAEPGCLTYALAAVTRRPVNAISRAKPSGTSRPSRCRVPTSAVIPMLISCTQKNASALA